MGHDGVPAGSDKAFNFEILLDGFEEEFDFPTRLVNVGNSLGIKREIVRKEGELFVGFFVMVANQSELTGILFVLSSSW